MYLARDECRWHVARNEPVIKPRLRRAVTRDVKRSDRPNRRWCFGDDVRERASNAANSIVNGRDVRPSVERWRGAWTSVLDAPDFRGTRDGVIADPLAAYYRPALRTRSYLPTYSPRVSFYQLSANNHSPGHLSRRYHSLTDRVLRLITAERDSNRDHLFAISSSCRSNDFRAMLL